jgi:hypothetical protein
LIVLEIGDHDRDIKVMDEEHELGMEKTRPLIIRNLRINHILKVEETLAKK